MDGWKYICPILGVNCDWFCCHNVFMFKYNFVLWLCVESTEVSSTWNQGMNQPLRTCKETKTHRLASLILLFVLSEEWGFSLCSSPLASITFALPQPQLFHFLHSLYAEFCSSCFYTILPLFLFIELYLEKQKHNYGKEDNSNYLMITL